ncbi:MAG: Tetratricopeptide repeat protein [Anaerolineales bacterium]|nr:Tetratricopeptide repeat protein [Anaerolineales bacterium]
MPDLTGQTLGGYRILNQIGKGGMATVYRAFQPSLERYVAVKVLPAYFVEQDESFLERFRLEARSVARLRHPNILTIYEYGEQEGVTFIVMEYVEAGTLTERLAAGRMTLAEIEAILRQVAAALSHAHDEGVVHRDVKPSNILLPKPNWPLLTDFGLARIVGGAHLTTTGTIAGTPAYMSPEQGRGETVDHRSDIYSLGIVLYEMTTGRVPFTAETPMAVIVKHIVEPLPLPRTIEPALPESVEAVILKALAKDPADRYDRADAMAQALGGAIAAGATGPTTTLHPVGPAVRTVASHVPSAAAKPRRRGVLPLAVGGLVGCALLSCLAVVILRNQRGEPPAPTHAPATEAAAQMSPEATPTFGQLMADGQALLDQGDPDAATNLFQAAIAADPGNLDLYWEISNIFRDLGYPDHARAFADAAVEAGPDEAWFHETTGWEYYYLGANPEAMAAFQRALELDSNAVWSYIGLSEAAIAVGDVETSRAALDTLSGIEPVSDPDLYESLGWGYYQLSAYPEAQAAFNQAIGQDPAKVGAWSGLINAVYDAEGAQAALEITSAAIAANPKDAGLHHQLGDLTWELGDAAGAESAFRTSIEIDPAYTEGYLALAGFLEDTERGDEAIGVLELGQEQDPNDPWLHEALGEILSERGEAERAFAHFSTASDLEPTYGWFALEAAVAYHEHSGDPEGTAVWLERAAAAQPDDADLLDSVGQMYEAIGDCTVASPYFTRALEINPELESSQEGLARCG